VPTFWHELALLRPFLDVTNTLYDGNITKTAFFSFFFSLMTGRATAGCTSTHAPDNGRIMDGGPV